jgi:fucose permease
MSINASPSRRAPPPERYRRDGFTWLAFGGLLAIGFLQSLLGPALPYIRSIEDISYLMAALHQAAFAVGGGLAGLANAGPASAVSRSFVIRLGLLGMAVAAIGVGYGDVFAVTVSAALFMSLLGTSATVRLWSALADAHRQRRTLAMTEGEVSVSVGGVVAPLVMGAVAATALDWRFAFVVGALLAGAVVVASVVIRVPPEVDRPTAGAAADPRRMGRPTPMLVVVFAVVAFEWSLAFWLASYLDDDVGLSRGLAVGMVSGVFAAALVGRLAASRLAARMATGRLLALSLGVAAAGLPFLLAAEGPAAAGVGLALAGFGSGATFPLTSSLHVGASAGTATVAVGQVMATASLGQIVGPIAVGAIAQASSLRAGLLLLPALAVLAALALARHARAENLDHGVPPTS